MTPGAYIALARDIAIGLALAFLVWRIYTDGKNSVKVSDMAAVQAQITANAQKEEGWRSQADVASKQLQSDLANIHAVVAQHTDPIVLRVPARCSQLPATAAGSASQSAASGNTDAGSGIDLRSQVSAFEERYEGLLAGCRAALASWPK